jgi:hypothetical protein
VAIFYPAGNTCLWVKATVIKTSRNMVLVQYRTREGAAEQTARVIVYPGRRSFWSYLRLNDSLELRPWFDPDTHFIAQPLTCTFLPPPPNPTPLLFVEMEAQP